MINFLSIIGAILFLCVLVLFHETGHFLVARAFGFTIEEFSVGFGPLLVSKTGKSGTKYSVRALPLGGFCRFNGEDEENSTDPHAFNNEKSWKRFLVLIAGSAMNIIIAFLIAVAVLCIYGDYAVTVEKINTDSPAYHAGLLPGDIITKVNDKRVVFDFGALDEIATSDPSRLTITAERNGEEVEFVLHDIYNPEEEKNMIGVMLRYNEARRYFTFGEAISSSFAFLGYFVKQLFEVFAGILRNPASTATQFIGPVGTISVIGAAVRSGWETILRFMILIGVNLGIFNLLPLPALDGGRVIFTVIEMIFRRPVPRKIEGVIHFLGFVLLMLFAVYLTFGDLGRLFGV